MKALVVGDGSRADAARALADAKPDVLVVTTGSAAAWAASLDDEARPAVILVGDAASPAFAGDDWVATFDDPELDARMRLAMVRARDRRRSARRALVDPLTQLPNRRAAIRGLVHAASRAKRDGSGVSIVLLDLDHFKTINDTLGHDEGDRVLRRVGAALARVVRREELAARIGGDEFAVVATGSIRAARAVVRRIRAALAREGVHATLAAGELRPGERLRDLYRRTDAILRAKKGHRAGYHAAA